MSYPDHTDSYSHTRTSSPPVRTWPSTQSNTHWPRKYLLQLTWTACAGSGMSGQTITSEHKKQQLLRPRGLKHVLLPRQISTSPVLSESIRLIQMCRYDRISAIHYRPYHTAERVFYNWEAISSITQVCHAVGKCFINSDALLWTHSNRLPWTLTQYRVH